MQGGFVRRGERKVGMGDGWGKTRRGGCAEGGRVDGAVGGVAAAAEEGAQAREAGLLREGAGPAGIGAEGWWGEGLLRGCVLSGRVIGVGVGFALLALCSEGAELILVVGQAIDGCGGFGVEEFYLRLQVGDDALRVVCRGGRDGVSA
jgi:hypothetical protein